MNISIDAEKSFWQNSTFIYDFKKLQKASIERTYLTITKVIYDKPIDNIILNSENLKAFALRSGKDKDVHFNHFYAK